MGIIGAGGHSWDLVNGYVTVDGQIDYTTAFVIEIRLSGGKIWQENVNHDWWEKTLPTDEWSGGTTWGPGSPASADYATALAGTGQSIHDEFGDTWTINSDGRVVVNGRVDTTTWYVKALAYVNGVVYQENVNNDWWGKKETSDTWTGGTTSNPLDSKVTLAANQVYEVTNVVGKNYITAQSGDTVWANDITQWSGAVENDIVTGSKMTFVSGVLRTSGTGNSVANITGDDDVCFSYGPNDTTIFKGNSNAIVVQDGGGTVDFGGGTGELASLGTHSFRVNNMGSGSIDLTVGPTKEDFYFSGDTNAFIYVRGVTQAALNTAVANASTTGGHGYYEKDVKVGSTELHFVITQGAMPAASHFFATATS